MLARSNRLRDRKRFAVIYRLGKHFKAGGFSLRIMPNGLSRLREAVVVSKKTAKSAPVRNRIRRRVFAAIEDEVNLNNPYDIIISVYDRRLAEEDYARLKHRLKAVFEKAGMRFN